MAQGYSFSKTEINIKESMQRGSSMEKADMNGLMKLSMMENSKMEGGSGLEFGGHREIHVISTKESIKMT